MGSAQGNGEIRFHHQQAEMSNDGDRLIFIGGSPRSGTTLIQNMMDSHPLILGGPEFLHLPDIIELRRKLHSSIDREWIDIICTRDDVDSHIISLIKSLFLPLADKHRCEYYSEKTPENILVFLELIELFPEARFIQVIRDPRAIISSMQQVKKRAIEKGIKPPIFTTNTTTSVAYIKKCFDAGFKTSKHAPGKVLTVVYEHLLANPEMETKRICEYLGMEWSDLMLRPGDKDHLGNRAITVKSNEIWYDSKTYNRNLAIQNVGKWKSELALYHQLRATMVFAGNRELMQYGYDFSIDGLAHGHGVMSRTFIYGLSLGGTLYRSILFVIRKIPGISLIRNGLLTVTSFFRTNV